MLFEEKTNKISKTHQLKAIENPKIVDVKAIIIDYPKTSHKLTKTIKQVENFSQVSSGESCNSALYSEIKKVNIFRTKKCKNNEISTCF